MDTNRRVLLLMDRWLEESPQNDRCGNTNVEENPLADGATSSMERQRSLIMVRAMAKRNAFSLQQVVMVDRCLEKVTNKWIGFRFEVEALWTRKEPGVVTVSYLPQKQMQLCLSS